jgi:hypothetical protein
MGSADGIVILDRFGRVVHHNDTALVRWRLMAQPSDLRIGTQLLRGHDGTLPADIAKELPEELREQRIEPLMIDGALRGALLVLPPRPRPVAGFPASSMLPAAMTSAKAAIVGCSEALLQAVDKVERAALRKQQS